MIGTETYPEWTKPFNPTGKMEGSWEQGSEVRFIGDDPQTGEAGGMFAVIKENRPNEFISIEHKGIIQKGVVDTESEFAKKWFPAFENYTFNEKDGGTELLIDVDTADEFVDDFQKMWPAALEKLKELSEKS